MAERVDPGTTGPLGPLLDPPAIASGFGLYLHIPFCTTRCDYCAFATWTDHEDLIDAYVDALCLEIDRAKAAPYWRPPDTVFFGGGTPSLLSVEHIARALRHAGPRATAEVTVECNPESTTREFVREIADAGVNRISLGVQSRRAHVLAGLGRESFPGSVERAVEAIGSSGIANYNIDLVYGGAGETTEDFVATLEEVLEFDPRPSHISAYALTIESGTPIAREPHRHPDPDAQAERYELADQILEDHGFHWYEISNWSLPGHECLHNLSCWLGGEYLGVGCSAHSHIAGERFENIFSIERYVEAVLAAEDPRARGERLDDARRAEELLELQVRTRLGVPAETVDPTVFEDGLAVLEGDRAVLTLRGRLLANEVMMRIRPGGEIAVDGRAGSA